MGSPSPRADDLKKVECFKCHKRDIMPINAPNLRLKMEKCAKLMISDLNRNLKLSLCARFEFGTQTSRRSVLIL